MIITLKTTTRDDPSRFANFFPEGLKIPPNAQISLVNSSFIIEKGFAIGATNDSFQLRLGLNPALNTIQINQGVYENADALALAFQNALQLWIATQSDLIQDVYPAAQQTIDIDATKMMTISLVFDQQNVALSDLNIAGVGLNNYVSNGTGITGANGDFIQRNVDYNNKSFLSSVGTPSFNLVSNSLAGGDYFAVYRFACLSNNHSSIDKYLLKINALVSPIVITCDWANATLDIEELANGTLSSILDGTVNILANQEVEISILQFSTDDSTVFTYANYNLDNVAIPISASAERYEIFPSTQLFTSWLPDGEPKVGQMPSATPTANLPTDITITTAGTNIRLGDILVQEAVAPAGGTGLKIQAVEVTAGALTQYEIENFGNGSYSSGDVVTFVAVRSGTPVVLTLNTVGPWITIDAPGTGYTDAQDEIMELTNGDPWPSSNQPRLTVTVVAGAVTAFTNIPVRGTGVVAGTQYRLAGGNADCLITILTTLSSKIPSTLGLQASLVEQDADDINPLQSQDSQRLSIPAGLRLLTGLPSNTIASGNSGLSITGSHAMAHNDTSSHILHVQVDEFQLESREGQSETQGGPNGKTIGVICAGSESPQADGQEGFYYKEQFNLIYNRCDNPQTVNHNELSVRLTDEMNNPFVGIKHPVVLTIDIKPDLR
jgi:hypothetical protein